MLRSLLIALVLMATVLKPYAPRVARFAFRLPELDARINILEGAVRSAKTWALHPKAITLTQYEVGGIKLFTGVSKQSIHTNMLNDLFNMIGPENYTYNTQSGALSLFGSKWLVMGAKDEGSEKYIRGATVGVVIGDELTLLPKSFVMMLLNRMSPDNARAYFTTNPDNPGHYVKKELLDNRKLRQDGTLFSMHFTLADNPHVSDKYKAYLNSLYAGVFRERFVLGKWVVAAGAIYRDAWSDELLYDDATRPKGLLVQGNYAERYVPIDYGTDHPQVYLDMFDDGRVIWVEREYVWNSHASTFDYDDQRWVPRDSHTQVTVQQKTDAQYADDLEVFLRARFNHNTGRWEPGTKNQEVDAQVILPPECSSFEAELVQRGIWYCAADNDVLDGIRTCSSAMTRKLVRIHKDNCPLLVANLQNHQWDEKAAKRGVEQPLKQDDDPADCFRYGIRTKLAAWRLTA